jgi:hypothetical protein
MTQSSRRRSHCIPRLECLDDRALPAATITQGGAALFIKGDAQANSIQITDNGTNAAGNVTVVADGQTFTSTSAVRYIAVYANGGGDTVQYSLSAGLADDANRLVSINLGAGDDSFTANLGGEVLGTRLYLSAYGNAGADILDLNAEGLDVAAGSYVNFNLNGGIGNDTITFDHTGVVNGFLTVVALGSDGDDSITGNLTVDEASTGFTSAIVWGGAGVDTIGLNIDEPSPNPFRPRGLVISGAGEDVVTHSDNVIVF